MKVRGFFYEFKEFAVKGNVVDLAVGIIIGGAFNKIVTSLVTGIILPPIGLLLKRVDFSNLYVSLNGEKYASLSAAQQAGAPVLMYGDFINSVITFVITAFAVFILVKQINLIRHRREQSKEAPSPTTKRCTFCFSEIPLQATRCPQCTSQLASPQAAA